MHINSIFDLNEGQFILLTCHGSEGLSVTYQSNDISEVVEHLNESYGSAQAIVKVVDIKVEIPDVY